MNIVSPWNVIAEGNQKLGIVSPWNVTTLQRHLHSGQGTHFGLQTRCYHHILLLNSSVTHWSATRRKFKTHFPPILRYEALLERWNTFLLLLLILIYKYPQFFYSRIVPVLFDEIVSLYD